MNRDIAGPSQYSQVYSQASVSSLMTQKNKRNRLSLTQTQKSVITKNKVQVEETDVFTSLLSPPKIFSQALAIGIKKAGTSSEHSVYSVEDSNKDGYSRSRVEDIPNYCPTCQMPFKNLRILPSVHAAQCDIQLDELPECSEGENCSSTSVFHYRDYAHTALAKAQATGKSSVVAHNNARALRTPLKEQQVKKKLIYSDSDCNSSSTKSLNWLLNHSQSKLPPVLCDEPAELSTHSGTKENNVPRENLCDERTLDSGEENLRPVLPNVHSSYQNSICGCTNNNVDDCVEQIKNGHIETCRVPCEDVCFEDTEGNSDDVCEKSLQAVLSVVLSPSKNGNAQLESPVKIQVSCGNDGWEEVSVDSCDGARIGSIKVTMCECSKNMQVNCVVGDSGISVNSTNFKLSTTAKESVPQSADHGLTCGDEDSEVSIVASSLLSSKLLVESSSYASSTSTVLLDSTIKDHKESIVSCSKNLSAKDQWRQLMPGLRDKQMHVPQSRGSASSTSVSTGSVYKAGPHCKRIPAALVRLKLRVDEKYIKKIDVDETKCISGVLVTALNANHCPGSLMFLFQLKDGRNFLHVGDFRADPKMESYPCFWNITIDILYLDTTYCHPKHTFPPQCEMVAKVVDIVSSHVSRFRKTLVVCGTYTIGKEKVFIAVAEFLNCKLWARADKRKVLECIQDPDIMRRLTVNPLDARVHVCPMGDLNFESLSSYLKQYSQLYTNILAFKPSGWELKAKGDEVTCITRGNVTICGVPYSEHSSFTELKRFVKFLKPKEVFPTVNLSSLSTMQKYFKEWLSENPLKRRNEESVGVQAKLTKYIVRQTSC